METTYGRLRRRINGQRFHIFGSASSKLSSEKLSYAHSLVKSLAWLILSRGASLVVQLGEEPIVTGTDISTTFDWDLLEQVVKIALERKIPHESIRGIPCIGVGFSDWKTRMPAHRADLIRIAIDLGVLEIVQLHETLHIGGVLRERQSFFGDILVTLGGGTGAYHMVELYRQKHKPIIPLDLSLDQQKRLATEVLYSQALEKPQSFFFYEPRNLATAALTNLSLKNSPSTDDFNSLLLNFVENLAAPRAFFAHLMNNNFSEHELVRKFFENVVLPFIKTSGYSRFDPGLDSCDEPFLNVEIFRLIEESSLLVVDLTQLRQNCLIELGYGLGLGKKIIVTAIKCIHLPFDIEALPCHFWDPSQSPEKQNHDFENFVNINLNRRKIE
jgi:hypothetical protein